MSVRLKLTLSYAGVIVVTGVLLLAVVWVFLLRYVPDGVWLEWPEPEPGRPRGPFVPNRSDLERAFAPRAATMMGFLVVFGLVGGWVLAGRMLAPLTKITEATRTAATGSLSHRIALDGPGDEFRELADGFDDMLEKLESQVAEQQRFAANASHELRTPLAITQTLLDVAGKDPNRDVDELLERLRLINSRAIDLTEALLVLSRADQRSFVREQVDLSLVAEEAVETLLPLAEQRGVRIETAGDPASVSGSPALLLQVATNLIHNAIVHNLPEGGPENGSVSVTIATGERSVVLTVANTGDKLSRELVATLTEPFQRGTQRIHGDHAGVGLGLAIVKSITRAHDGNLAVLARPGGGLRVSVELPRIA